MSDLILFDETDSIAEVVLNRPQRLNAFNLAMWRQLGQVMATVNANDALRCVILRGAGDKAFGAGADVAEFTDTRYSAAQAQAYAEAMEPVLKGVADCPHPTVASIHGACMGGGLELALLCDLRICGVGARFGIPINRIGHCLPYAGLRPLVDLVGPATAAEILLEGRILDAEAALAKGLVTRVVPDHEVSAETQATAARIAKGAPLAAREHKRFIRRLADPRPLSDAELAEPYALCDSADYREGIRAFLAKETPRFEGR